MFHRFSIILGLFYTLCCIPFVFASETDLSDLKKERESNQKHFLEMASQYQQCHRILQDSTDRFNNLQANILEKKTLCEKPQFANDYKKCIDSLSNTITDLKNLKAPASDLQQSCPLFSPETLLKRLSKTIVELEIDFDRLSARSDFIEMDELGDQSIHEKNKLSRCSHSIQMIGDGVLTWAIGINMTLVSMVPDIYEVTQGLSALKIYNDYVLQTLALCDEKVDPEKTNNYEMYANQIDVEQKQIAAHILEASNRYNSTKFNENTAKICQFLTNNRGGSDSNKAASAELCENPMNNPSWIYSAHYLVKDKRESLKK